MTARYARRLFWGFFALCVFGLLLELFIPALSVENTFELKSRTNVFSTSVALGMLVIITLFVLGVLAYSKRRLDSWIHWSCFAFVSVLYINILRETYVFGDFKDYANAAAAILQGQPFPSRYIYPPMWASALARIQSVVGYDGSIFFLFALNQLSIAVFFLLGTCLLQHCGLSRISASLLLAAALAVNVPFLRNLAYVQVNVLLLDLIMGSLLLYRRSSAGSAVLLAVATHLKVIPLLLSPFFLHRRKWPWAVGYALAGLGIVGVTVLFDGLSYYEQFFNNLGQWKPHNTRSSSFYALLYRTRVYLSIPLPVDGLYNGLRFFMAAWITFISWRSIRGRIFARTDSKEFNQAVNGVIPFLFILPAISPAVWSYHLTVLVISTLLIAVRLQSRGETAVWVTAYALTFWLPVFDWYPWSFLRLAGWITLLVLMHRTVLFPEHRTWFPGADRCLCSALEELYRKARSWNLFRQNSA